MDNSEMLKRAKTGSAPNRIPIKEDAPPWHSKG